MGSRKKIIKKMIGKRPPADMRFEEIKNILNYFEWTISNVKGSHVTFEKGSETLMVTIVNGRFVLRYQIKRVAERLNLEEWYANN